ETSGGAYVVAKEDLGTLPSLVAGAGLLRDYVLTVAVYVTARRVSVGTAPRLSSVLTVAVSVTAGVLALTSAAPSLEPHKVGLSLAFVVLLTVVNLRRGREAGVLVALPAH